MQGKGGKGFAAAVTRLAPHATGRSSPAASARGHHVPADMAYQPMAPMIATAVPHASWSVMSPTYGYLRA